jgi:hypothetical protein
MPQVMARVKAVQLMREKSAKAATRQKAATPTLFTENRQPKEGRYLAIPRTSSENRPYLPVGYLDATVIAANDLQMVPNATLYHFGMLSSRMHWAWTGVTAGRLESRIRYSVKYTYNTFPWPDLPEPPATEDATRPTPAPAAGQKKRAANEAAAQAVLDARASFPEASLADLYDTLAMPPALTKAHHHLDKTVDAAYAYKGQADDASRVAFLFGLYEGVINLQSAATAARTDAIKFKN